MSNAKENFAPGVELCFRNADGDMYLGKPEALIAAGLLRADQVPGWPGMPPSAATFFEGVLVERWTRVPHTEAWMNVVRSGSNIKVFKGISEAERARRIAEAEERERNKPKAAIGIEVARAEYEAASTRFKVGDKVMNGDKHMVVSGHYGLSLVWSKNGEFVHSNGRRFDYMYGYCCKYPNGEEFFFVAHCLLDDDGNQTHLRLVRGARREVRPAAAAFREQN